MNIFAWKDFNDYSRAAIKTPFNGLIEATYRTAISRSYYYAYHLCKKYADDNSISYVNDDGIGVHERLIRALKQSNIKTAKLLGQILEEMKDRRVQADYHRKFCHRYTPSEAANFNIGKASLIEYEINK